MQRNGGMAKLIILSKSLNNPLFENSTRGNQVPLLSSLLWTVFRNCLQPCLVWIELACIEMKVVSIVSSTYWPANEGEIDPI